MDVVIWFVSEKFVGNFIFKSELISLHTRIAIDST